VRECIGKREVQASKTVRMLPDIGKTTKSAGPLSLARQETCLSWRRDEFSRKEVVLYSPTSRSCSFLLAV